MVCISGNSILPPYPGLYISCINNGSAFSLRLACKISRLKRRLLLISRTGKGSQRFAQLHKMRQDLEAQQRLVQFREARARRKQLLTLKRTAPFFVIQIDPVNHMASNLYISLAPDREAGLSCSVAIKLIPELNSRAVVFDGDAKSSTNALPDFAKDRTFFRDLIHKL